MNAKEMAEISNPSQLISLKFPFMNEMFRHWCIKCLENKQQFVSVDFAENKGLQTN